MSEITTVTFETSSHGGAYLSELAEGPPYTVHGVALGAGDVTVGQSGIKKKWPASELKSAATSLKGTNLVVDHNNDTSGVVGRVTKSGYKEGTGVVYEADLYEDDLAQKVENGLLEVSIRGYHADVDSLEEDEETEAKIVTDITFDNLSIVPSGAAPSNTLQMGSHAELSAAELSAFTDDLDSAELAEIEPGMWVKWGDNRGITISQVQDGEIEVDIYEESDDQWRSTEQTEMVPTDDLSEWDVDEDNVGAVQKDEEENTSVEENRHNILMAGMMFFDSKNDSMLEIAEIEGDKVLMSSDGEADDGSWYETVENIYKGLSDGNYEYHDPDDEMPLVTEGLKFYSTTNDSVLEVMSVTDDMVTMSSMDENDSWEKPVDEIIDDLAEGEIRVFHPDTEIEEMASKDDKVSWQDGDATGVVVDRKTDGCFSERIDGDQEICASEDEAVVLIEIVKDGERTGTMVAHKEGTVNDADFEMASDELEASSGEFVKWKGVNNEDMYGQIVSINQDGQQMVAEIRRFTKSGDSLDEMMQKPLQGLDRWDRSPNSPDMSRDNASSVEPPTWQDGQMVKWQVNPSMKGKIVHIDREKKILMVEVMKESEQGMTPSGYTLTAGYQDVVPLDTENLAETYDDYPEAASENAQMALDAREETDNPNDCGTDVGWARANQLASGEALSRDTIAKMSAFNRHRSNSEMSDDEGRADCGWMMWKAWGGDEGVDWAKRKLDQIEEENAMNDVPSEHIFASKEDAEDMADELGIEGAHQMDGRWMPGDTHEMYMEEVQNSDNYENSGYSDDEDDEEMQEGNYEMHEVSYDGTTESDWSRPDMEDFDTDDLSEIANHFIISETGFPPENYGDLKLPVVEPSGELNVNALAAVKGGRGVSEVDGLLSDMEDEIVDMVNNLANSEFDREWGMEENAAKSNGIDGSFGRPTSGEPTGNGVRVLSGDDLQNGIIESSNLDSLNKHITDTNMTEDITEKISELSEPVAVEASEVEELREKADRFEEMTESLESLRERTEVLDSVDRSQVEELAESDEPMVIESEEYEQLSDEADQVKEVYAASLSEEYDAFSAEELADKFSIDELREKYEDNFGSIDELASSEDAQPRSQDADEESLEDAADEQSESTSEEELSDEVASKQKELQQKILDGI